MVGIGITKCVLSIEAAPEGKPSSLAETARPAEAPALPAAHLSAKVMAEPTHQPGDGNVR